MTLQDIFKRINEISARQVQIGFEISFARENRDFHKVRKLQVELGRARSEKCSLRAKAHRRSTTLSAAS